MKARSFYPLYLANKPVENTATLDVTDKFSGEVFTKVGLADGPLIDQAIAAAVQAAPKMAALPAYERQDILNHCVARFKERAEELAYLLCLECGKPMRDAKGEVTRLIDTFRIASEEAVRMTGEVLPLDITPRAKNYVSQWKRVPIGPCSFISPFNFPLNLVAHKVAPAIAVGCPFILKPASRTPLGALVIGEILAETSLPKGAFSILPCQRDGADLFTVDERLKLLSFTGSPAVGWDLKKKSGKKKVVLELGGNAAVVIDEDANVDDAVARVLFGAFYSSGQSCISVQRIYIHAKLYESFKTKIVAETKKLKSGDPRHEDTFVGPMISEEEAKRLEQWVQSAIKHGATLLCGGKRQKSVLEPTLLENVQEQEKISCEEAFGPVAILAPFKNYEEALQKVNASKFGLQAGVFTKNIEKAYRAWDALDVGGVVINDIPAFRVDNMPYGGVKDSGFGREGVRFAMEDMTEIRLMVVRRGG